MTRFVPRAVVVGLVDDFIASGKPHCSSFAPDEMRSALNALPGEVIECGAVFRVLNNFACHKLTSHCNSWTPWMRQRLRNSAKSGMVTDAHGRQLAI